MMPGALLLALAAAAVAPSTEARVYHTQSMDHMVVRCSTVNTALLPQTSLSRYGIDGNKKTGLLSCVVQKQQPGQEPVSVKAHVNAQYHTIGEAPDPVHIKEDRSAGFVAYVGTFPVRTSYPITFRVDVKAGGESVEMNFDDQTPSM